MLLNTLSFLPLVNANLKRFIAISGHTVVDLL